MEHVIYLASESLLQKKILKRASSKPNSHIETLALEPDAIKMLEQSIFQKTAKRHFLELDLNHISSSGLSGGGAYSRRK